MTEYSRWKLDSMVTKGDKVAHAFTRNLIHPSSRGRGKVILVWQYETQWVGIGSFARAIVLDKIVDEHADEICLRTWASQRNVSQAQAEIRRISISSPDGTRKFFGGENLPYILHFVSIYGMLRAENFLLFSREPIYFTKWLLLFVIMFSCSCRQPNVGRSTWSVKWRLTIVFYRAVTISFLYPAISRTYETAPSHSVLFSAINRPCSQNFWHCSISTFSLREM